MEGPLVDAIDGWTDRQIGGIDEYLLGSDIDGIDGLDGIVEIARIDRYSE